jgi:hypothetical protein
VDKSGSLGIAALELSSMFTMILSAGDHSSLILRPAPTVTFVPVAFEYRFEPLRDVPHKGLRSVNMIEDW